MAISITYFFLLLFFTPQITSSITFDLKTINPQNQNEIITSGDTFISAAGIQLTPEDMEFVGRATYVKPLHLWDKNTSQLASFSTHFSFILSPDIFLPEGFAFFLAANNSVLTGGPALGLPVDKTTHAMKFPFVALEFDTWWTSDWDPPNMSVDDYHVGINVDSLSSVRFKKWLFSPFEYANCEARIKYDHVSKNLSLSVTDYKDGRVTGVDYIVDLTHVLPEWVTFGFTGAGGFRNGRFTVKSWAFNSSTLQVDEKIAVTSNPNNTSVKGRNNKGGGGPMVGLIIGGVIFVFTLFAIVSFCLWRKRTRRDPVDDENLNKDFEMGTGPKRFSYQQVVQATAGFVDANKLGEGGFGGVYKGFLKDPGIYVAVKKMSKASEQGIKEYASEVKIISRLRHRNLVELKGWCHKKGELLLVYDYMENGSLDLHLFKGKSLLTWGTRYRIAHGLASALLYLHHEWEQCILHRDIKSSNVMLDSVFNAKLGDFGLAKLVDHEKGFQTTILAGTFGYMAPECLVTGKASRESDVFSFGVVALEIACGRKPIDHEAIEKQTRLIDWVWELYGTESILKAVDPRLGLNFEKEEIKRLMIVGLWCVHPNPELRPSMTQVYHVLNAEASLPILPSNMPVTSYSTPGVLMSSNSSKQMTCSTSFSELYGR